MYLYVAEQVGKVVWQNSRIAATHGWFSCIHQVVPMRPPSHASLGLPRVHTPNSISIGWAIFVGLTIVTDRPHYSVTSGCIHVELQCDLIRPHWLPCGCSGKQNEYKLESTQRDGRPAEYRWHPLFNDAKFGWRPLQECCAVTLPRRETRWN